MGLAETRPGFEGVDFNLLKEVGLEETRSEAIRSLAEAINHPGFEGVDFNLLQEVVPSPIVEALLKLGKTCAALDSHVLRLEARCGNLDVQVGRLKQLFIAKRTPPPMERGMTFWPTGDPIPSRSQTDELEGDTYAFGTNALRFTKNKSGRELEPGEYFMGGQVDYALRHKVQVNDFFWLEL